MTVDPHGTGRLVRSGPTPATARRAMILVHGRGSSADQMVDLLSSIGVPDVAAFAPEAAHNSWWPTSFLAPMADLGLWLTSALDAVDRAVEAALGEGFTADQLIFLGFSQGGCLALEAAARRGGPLAGIVGLSAGLVGTADDPDAPIIRGYPGKSFDYTARLDGVSAYVSCHTEDPHIPLERVCESEATLKAIGAVTEVRIKPGAGHGIDERDVAAVRSLLVAA
ncbi:MAG: phospholipase [Devosia sp.]